MAAWKPRQTAVNVGEQPMDLRTVRPADMEQIRELEQQSLITCPACGDDIRVVIDRGGPVGEHMSPMTHENEDPPMRFGKHLLLQRMRELFPSAIVDTDISLDHPHRLVDVVAVRDNGGRLAIELQGADMKKGQLEKVVAAYREEAIRCLWLLDWRRAKPGRQKGEIVTLGIGKLEVDMIRVDEPLLYFDIQRKEVVRVLVPSSLQPLINTEKTTSLGRLPCLVRRYTLDQLRIREGSWFVDTTFDRALPSPPDLPKRLQDKLEKLSEVVPTGLAA